MSTFTLKMSCLTTFNLPWFMDLTFQVSVQCCSLQYWTLFPSLITSTTGHCFRFGSVSSFFLELFFHSSPVAYWAPTDLGSSSFSVIYFCLFIVKITTAPPLKLLWKKRTRCRMSQKPWCKIWGLFYNWSAWSDSLSESISVLFCFVFS